MLRTGAAGALALVLLIGCSMTPAAAPEPSPTEDPRVAELTTELDWYRDQLAKAQEDARAARAKAEHIQCCGTFPMWTGLTRTVSPERFSIVGVPDTFTFHLRFESDHPVRARIMTYGQLVDLVNGKNIQTPYSWGPTISLDVDFHEAEGCAFYVLVLDAQRETVFRPDVWITLAPAPGGTGACR